MIPEPVVKTTVAKLLSLDDAEIEESKRDLITREIGKFREVMKVMMFFHLLVFKYDSCKRKKKIRNIEISIAFRCSTERETGSGVGSRGDIGNFSILAFSQIVLIVTAKVNTEAREPRGEARKRLARFL